MLIHPNFDPVVFSVGPLAVRWYGLMYLTGFGAGWWLGSRRIAAGRAPVYMRFRRAPEAVPENLA